MCLWRISSWLFPKAGKGGERTLCQAKRCDDGDPWLPRFPAASCGPNFPPPMSGKGWLLSSIGSRTASKMPHTNGNCSLAQKGTACQQDVMHTHIWCIYGVQSKLGHDQNPMVCRVFPCFLHWKCPKSQWIPPFRQPGHSPASQAHGRPCRFRCCSSNHKRVQGGPRFQWVKWWENVGKWWSAASNLGANYFPTFRHTKNIQE